MGSKNDIAEQIVDMLPKAHNFYDLFAGGCAITHAAIMSGKYRNFIANDLQGMGVQLFTDSIAGKYENETRWVSRKDFFAGKYTDPYIALCWSFGNNMQNYAYSVEIEEWKHALHNAYFFNDMRLLWSMGINPQGNTRKWIMTHGDECRNKYIQWYFYSKSMHVPTDEDRHKTEELLNATKQKALKMLQQAMNSSGVRMCDINRHTGTHMASHWFTASQWQFPTPEMYEKICEIIPTLPIYNSYEYIYITQSLQNLESMNRLQSLQSLQVSYDDVEILPNSIIYCDPPYQRTAQYVTGEFDSEAFFKWCRKQTEFVVVSEYNAPSDFECVAILDHKSKLQGGMKHTENNRERLFVRKNQLHLFHKQRLFSL